MSKQYKILAINPGSTSTKIAVYLDETCQFEQTIRHNPSELVQFPRFYDQYEFRLSLVTETLQQHNVKLQELAAVVGRGGPLKPMDSGTYEVNEAMCKDLRIGIQSPHASNLGGLLARGIADMVGIPAFIVNPVSVDELEPVARITGVPQIQRRSLFHALNLKAVARRASQDLAKPYDACTLVLVHLGGGISVAIQKYGRMIDVCPDDAGPFSPERSGMVPAYDLVKMCYSGYTQAEVEKKLIGNAGLVAHLGTNDGREIERRIAEGDAHAQLIYQAMAYNIAKELGAMSTVADGKIDAIVLTGGLAYSEMLVGMITEKVKSIANVMVYPGEDELKSLVEGALRVLRGEEQAKQY